MNKFVILTLLFAVAAVSSAKAAKKFSDCDKLVNKKDCTDCVENDVDNKKCKKQLKNKDAKKAKACAAKVKCIKDLTKKQEKKEKKEWEALEAKYTSFCPTSKDKCQDKSASCPSWATRNPSECTKNPDFMLANCANSCCPVCTGKNTLKITPGVCPKRSDLCTTNTHSSCHKWANLKKSECTANKKWMRTNCMQSCCEKCKKDTNNCPTVKESCATKYAKPNKKKGAASCVSWAKNGECQTNSKWMNSNCAKECCPICRAEQPVVAQPRAVLQQPQVVYQQPYQPVQQVFQQPRVVRQQPLQQPRVAFGGYNSFPYQG